MKKFSGISGDTAFKHFYLGSLFGWFVTNVVWIAMSYLIK